jgi:hypothetical protein
MTTMTSKSSNNRPNRQETDNKRQKMDDEQFADDSDGKITFVVMEFGCYCLGCYFVRINLHYDN